MVARGHIAAARRLCRVVIVPSGWREDWTNPMFEGCQRDQPPQAPSALDLSAYGALSTLLAAYTHLYF